MLKLQLHKGDKVVIGDVVIIDVMSTGRTMQVGIEAPIEIEIKRIPKDITTFGQNAKSKEGRAPLDILTESSKKNQK